MSDEHILRRHHAYFEALEIRAILLQERDNNIHWQGNPIDDSCLGICYMGTILWAADKISEQLNLPETVVPVTSLVVGFPDEDIPEVRYRLPLEANIPKPAQYIQTEQGKASISSALVTPLRSSTEGRRKPDRDGVWQDLEGPEMRHLGHRYAM